LHIRTVPEAFFMSLSIELRRIDQIVILELAGRVSVLESQLRQLAERLVQQGERFFLINLANVSYMDNSGLGQLCLVYTIARNRGGDMRLLKPTERIRKLLTITKLDGIFTSYESEREAVESMSALTPSLSA
jgi:anti-sigma B factor antagonist